MTPTTAQPLRLVREARDLLLDAARSASFLKRQELVLRADERLQTAERVLRRGTT